MDARCHFKRKVGIIEEALESEPEASDDDDEAGEAEQIELTEKAQSLSEVDRKA